MISLSRKPKLNANSFFPEFFSLHFFLLCSSMASKLCFYFLLQSEAVCSLLEAQLLSARDRAASKCGKFQGIQKEQISSLSLV